MDNNKGTNFVLRDNKSLLGPGEKGPFLLTQAALATVSLCVGLPIALVGGVVGLGRKLLTGGPETQAIGKKFDYPPVSPCLVADLKPLAEREFDLVVFGATGFTGELMAKYLAKQYRNNEVKWCIAGRRKDALERVKQACVALNPALKDLVVLDGVDSAREESLQRMTARARVVVTTVGPFQLYGTPLVRACLSTGTSCCDITGEVDWYGGLVEAYDAEARARGCKIVSFCGHDCVPWELMTYKLAKALGKEPLRSVRMQDEVVSAPSGGTLATVLATIDSAGAKPKSRLGFSALYLNEKGEQSGSRTKDVSSLLPSNDNGMWAGPFVMAAVNAQVVKRSNALNGYGPSLSYFEARAASSFSVVAGRYLQLLAMAPVLFFPKVLQEKFLPQPGSGPSMADMQHGFLQVTGTGKGEAGTEVRARIYFPNDPGYVDTARMLAETGLAIALTPQRCDRAGGVLTPGTCCPDALLERLIQSGTEFAYLSQL